MNYRPDPIVPPLQGPGPFWRLLPDGGWWRSDDGGTNWTKVSADAVPAHVARPCAAAWGPAEREAWWQKQREAVAAEWDRAKTRAAENPALTTAAHSEAWARSMAIAAQLPPWFGLHPSTPIPRFAGADPVTIRRHPLRRKPDA